MTKLPTISIAIPTFNEEKNIGKCLASIFRQNYPKKLLEVFVVDDYSTDETVKIAKEFGAKILYNGTHNCERGRSISLKRAKGDLFLIMDADNILVSRFWLKKYIQAFLENPDLVGAQTGWWEYDPKDYIVNRYCALFGSSKPMVFYLKKRGLMMATEKNWIYPQTLVQEKNDYFLVQFTPENLPTLGSQGFLGQRKLLLKTTYEPFFFHMDSVYELVRTGDNLFAIMKLGIVHRHADSFLGFHQKFYRDVSRFFYQRQSRKYLYKTDKLRLIWAVLAMVSVIVPLIDSFKGFLKIRDFAWFLHPLLCQTTLWLSVLAFLKWKIGLKEECFLPNEK